MTAKLWHPAGFLPPRQLSPVTHHLADRSAVEAAEGSRSEALKNRQRHGTGTGGLHLELDPGAVQPA